MKVEIQAIRLTLFFILLALNYDSLQLWRVWSYFCVSNNSAALCEGLKKQSNDDSEVWQGQKNEVVLWSVKMLSNVWILSLLGMIVKRGIFVEEWVVEHRRSMNCTGELRWRWKDDLPKWVERGEWVEWWRYGNLINRASEQNGEFKVDKVESGQKPLILLCVFCRPLIRRRRERRLWENIFSSQVCLFLSKPFLTWSRWFPAGSSSHTWRRGGVSMKKKGK